MEETGGKAAESWLHSVKVGCCNSASEHPSDGWRVSASRGKHSAHSTATPKDRGIKSDVLSWSILIQVSGAVHLRGLAVRGALCCGPARSLQRSPWGAGAFPQLCLRGSMGSGERTEQAANAQGAAHSSRWLFTTWQPLSGYVHALHPRLQMKLNFFSLNPFFFFAGAE